MHRISGESRPGPQAAWGGIILSILGIHWQDILQTAILAAIGTTVSFSISLLLKKLHSKWRKS